MPEEKIYIRNGSLIIEGLLSKASEENGVVICHPHSLMGGSMHNNVVEALQEAYAAENYSTLRFNFRGVGASTGFYDEGRGEKEDIFAVCEYLKKMGLTKLLLAGYSFGAWVGSKVLEESNNPFVDSIFVSPPVDYFNFNWDNLDNKINFIICGDHDQFCMIDVIIKIAQKINSPLEIIRGADHFYMGKDKELAKILRKRIIESNNKKTKIFKKKLDFEKKR
jgi:hypothetical protein